MARLSARLISTAALLFMWPALAIGAACLVSVLVAQAIVKEWTP